ncbi:MAG: helix-turn-helix domain-containing protein [Bacilli bacterium]|nr:helix-turn-helix domain-containing protein [Bacilli bacterium]
MTNFFELSTPEIVQYLGKRFKEYRIIDNLTQKEIAQKTGIGITTIAKFESGTAYNISLSTLIILLKTIKCINNIKELMPDMTNSPYLVKEDNNKVKRVRHKK